MKPNLIRHYNANRSIDAQITPGAFIRAVLDLVYLALNGEGSITIGDAPIQCCNLKSYNKILLH